VLSTEFFKHTLLFLAYTPLEAISTTEQQAIAFDVGIAALISPEIYNFGELV
jgi:26S proteasome regulatory subunit N9